MRAFLTRHAAVLYTTGGIALVAGVAIFLHVANDACAALGASLAATGLFTMGITHSRVGA